MTEENDKMNSHPAPREPLSERVQRLAYFADAHCGEDELLMLLVRAIREQQAALEGALSDDSAVNMRARIAARAVLAKWRIE